MSRTVIGTLAVFLIGTPLFPTTALAQASDSEQAEQLVRKFVESRISSTSGRKEIAIDLSSPRQKLLPCKRIEPFLPLSAQPTGRITVGIRCAEGASWTAFRTAIVKTYGPAAVATHALPMGSALTSADYRMAEIELGQAASSVITDPAELIDKTLARAIEPGQPLKRDMLRIRYVVSVGDPVRLAYVGAGFTVTAGGKSLGSASEGQRVRAQADNGRILTGTARANRIIEVYF